MLVGMLCFFAVVVCEVVLVTVDVVAVSTNSCVRVRVSSSFVECIVVVQEISVPGNASMLSGRNVSVIGVGCRAK